MPVAPESFQSVSFQLHNLYKCLINSSLNKENLNSLLDKQLPFFYKQLGSGLSPESCWYFQGFWGSKLLNVC